MKLKIAQSDAVRWAKQGTIIIIDMASSIKLIVIPCGLPRNKSQSSNSRNTCQDVTNTQHNRIVMQ